MDYCTVKEIIDCVSDERRTLYYFKDKYCLKLMALFLRSRKQEVSLRELKSDRFGPFLQKRTVSDWLNEYRSSTIRVNDLDLLGPFDQLAFNMTFDHWGNGERGYDQTSRNGSNLVLQLNFSNHHDEKYQSLIKPGKYTGPFEARCHPINKGQRCTLGWARLDIDFTTNEVLIEEIQNDWLRKARWALAYLLRKKRIDDSTKPEDLWNNVEGSFENFEHYVKNELQCYEGIWQEAVLCAAMQFIVEELGIKNIYYHTAETGYKVKAVYSKPPTSIYSKLPKKFLFRKTSEAPRMLAQNKKSRRYLKAIGKHDWYKWEM